MNANQLKKSILQYAIEGKLVTQNTSDESTSELLKRISEQKEHMIKEKIIKKEKSLPLITEEEVPFDIPDTWKWVRLKSISTFGNFNQATPEKIDPDDWVLDLEDIEKNTGRILKQKSASEKIIKSNKYKFNQNDVLYGKLRPYLNKVTIAPREGYCTTEIFPITLIEGVYSKYIQNVLMSPYFLNYAHGLSYGVKMPRLGTAQIANTLIPLPPTNEQIRIVDKTEELFLKINSYDTYHLALENLNTIFPKKLEKSILQYAIQGKLVNQDISDEPASELLKRILQQKEQMVKEKIIKKEKALLPIIEEEIPFGIPDTWEWVRLGEICVTNIGVTYKPESITTKEDTNSIPVLRSTNIQDSLIDLNDLVYVNSEVRNNQFLHSGDILMCVRNGSPKLVGKTAIVNYSGMAFGAFMSKVSSPINEYLQIFFQSNVFKDQLVSSKTTTINQITQYVLKNILVPIPPLTEQKRIVFATNNVLNKVKGKFQKVF